MTKKGLYDDIIEQDHSTLSQEPPQVFNMNLACDFSILISKIFSLTFALRQHTTDAVFNLQSRTKYLEQNGAIQ